MAAIFHVHARLPSFITRVAKKANIEIGLRSDPFFLFLFFSLLLLLLLLLFLFYVGRIVIYNINFS